MKFDILVPVQIMATELFTDGPARKYLGEALKLFSLNALTVTFSNPTCLDGNLTRVES